jgi:hypothetical protein
MRLLPTLLLALALSACGRRYGAACDTGEDCFSGLCARVTSQPCMGIKACTKLCTEDADCGEGSRCLPDGVCEVHGARGVLCY